MFEGLPGEGDIEFGVLERERIGIVGNVVDTRPCYEINAHVVGAHQVKDRPV